MSARSFATIPVRGHVENWRVRSDDFSEWLSGRCFVATGAAPSSQALKDASRVMEAHAKHIGPEHPVFLRIGERDGAVFVDLGDAQWRSIEVTPEGWCVIDRAPVKFIRSPHIRALPTPEDGGLIEQELRDLVNVQGDADFKLIVAWVIGCFNPRGPYPILAINGEHGSAKSTLCRLLRRLTESGVTILCASHDVALLRRHATSVILLEERRAEVTNAAALEDWYV